MCNLKVVIQSPIPYEQRRTKRPRVRRACLSCQSKKVKCSGTVPCKLCSERGLDCVFKASKMYPNEIDQPGEDPQAIVRKNSILNSYNRSGSTSSASSLDSSNSPSGGGTKRLCMTTGDMTNLSRYLDADIFRRILVFIPQQAIIERVLSSPTRDCIMVAAAAVAERCEKTSSPPVRQSYAEQAKKLVSAHISNPSIDSVVAIMLVGYAEAALGSFSACWLWLGLANRMAQQLHLESEPVDSLGHNVYWSLVVVDKIISFEADMPEANSPQTNHQGVEHEMCRLLSVLSPLTKFLKDPSEEPQHKLVMFHKEITAALPADMAFTHDNLQAFSARGQLHLFLMLHMWRQALGMLITYPSLAYQCSPFITRTTAITPTNCNLKMLVDLATNIDPNSFLSPLLARPLCIVATTALNMLDLVMTDRDYMLLKDNYHVYKNTLLSIRDAGWTSVVTMIDELEELEEQRFQVSFSATDYWDIDTFVDDGDQDDEMQLFFNGFPSSSQVPEVSQPQSQPLDHNEVDDSYMEDLSMVQQKHEQEQQIEQMKHEPMMHPEQMGFGMIKTEPQPEFDFPTEMSLEDYLMNEYPFNQ